MVLRRVKKVVRFTAHAARKTAQKVQHELLRLQKSGVLSKTDVAKLVKLVSHEAEGSKKRLFQFAKSELKHEAAIARTLGSVVLSRAKQAAKVLRENKQKPAKKKRKK